MYQCPICANTDRKYFAFKNSTIYCRKCIGFQNNEIIQPNHILKDVSLSLDYPLSIDQENISNQVLECVKNKQNVLIQAVCGAGKTELVFQSIKYCLENNLQVGFAIPRKDVVVDLLPRLKKAFPNQKVTALYGGHHNEKTGDIIILTTHQLYRYQHYFDLLIIDEIDAFPYKNNSILNHFFQKAIKQNYILMSATAREDTIKKIRNDNGKIFYLDKRYHNHPLPVPTIITNPFSKKIHLLFVLKKFMSQNLPTLIFTPTISLCKQLYQEISFIQGGNYVYSEKDDRINIIEDFKNNKYKYLVTTSILERGITIKNLQVIIYQADHPIYNEQSLIQISGRVGRKIDAYDGEVIWISDYITSDMEQAKAEIIRANES